ncbi:LysR family transcriptional regulator [Paraburkholderia rhynchosiae]|uniref:HTH-type transcriptional regulator TsaR n=1 Tax=Paraburkholderia rhynchosiae TaxID=487049 RepID=A0A2N7WXD8_9BURK|nr:LysR family transcriptional regulator [Paraburkholderia rhynchosiae]PMS34024.1 LysR family transcriptional regulator [Paraburkholderia rhynchosiae]CAB3636028.1 HTH-type transcriptional regulator TsaR [Paraburkholderia rhynchosiae]
MKNHQLRALVAIADAGSVRGAARTLGLSPSAITQALKDLEECLNAPLIKRASSGATLTEFGNTLLTHARLIVSQVERAHGALNEMRGEPGGKLSVAITPWIALCFLSEVFTQFRKRMPNVQLEIFEGFLSVANPRLRDGSAEVFVGRQAPDISSPEFNFRPLFSSGLTAVARQGHPLAESRSLADLIDADWLVSLDSDMECRLFKKMFYRNGLPEPRNVHFTHSLTVAASVLQRTDAVSIFPWPLAELCVARYKFCAFPVREELADSSIGIVSRSGHPLSAAANCLIEILLETIRNSDKTGTAEARRALQSTELLF